MFGSLNVQMAASPLSSDSSFELSSNESRRSDKKRRNTNKKKPHLNKHTKYLDEDEENGVRSSDSSPIASSSLLTDEDDHRSSRIGVPLCPVGAERSSLNHWLHSPIVSTLSTIINISLLLFLVWARYQPPCSNQGGVIRIESSNEIRTSSSPGPVGVVMPEFKNFDAIATPQRTIERKLSPSAASVRAPAPRTTTVAPVTIIPTIPIREGTLADPPATPGSIAAAPASTPPEPVSAPNSLVVPSSSSFPNGVNGGVDEFQRNFNVAADHLATWNYCEADFQLTRPVNEYKESVLGVPPSKFCPEILTNEQLYQLSWFGAHVAIGFTSPQRFVPPFMDCIHLPPTGYQWPVKYNTLPCEDPKGCVNWPNLRVNSYEELVEFNRATPKNLYHFNAKVYDLDGREQIRIAAKYIPLKEKVRNMLDIGAGGGSFGLLLKRKYDIQTIATAFADWPYCEYMTERGELCLLLDVMEAMPFAKFSFDMIHVSWVYHGQSPSELWDFMHELDRLLRPGGYLYLRGGWSNSQIIAQRNMLANLGYTILHETMQHKLPSLTAKISFGPDLPYHADWTAIYVKPIKALPADQSTCAQRKHQQSKGKPVIPIPVRITPSQTGNVYES